MKILKSIELEKQKAEKELKAMQDKKNKLLK